MLNRVPRPLLVTGLCAALQGVGGGLGWSVVPPLMPSIAADLGLTHAVGGLVWGAAPLGIAFASLFGGGLVDRFGARWTAGLAMLVGAAACGSRAFVPDVFWLTVSMFAFGLHVGFVAPAIPKALAGHVTAAKLARANGLALLAYTLGTAATVLTARTVLAPALGGWRPTMLFAAAAMAITGVLWLSLVRDRVAFSKHAPLAELWSLAQNGALRRVAAMHFCLFGGYLALLGLLGRSLVEAGLAPARVGLAVAGWLVAAAVGNLFGPVLSDRLGLRRPFIIAGAMAAGTALGLLALSPSGASLWLLGVAALGGGCFAPLLLTLPLELPGVGRERVGGALSLLMLVGQLGGFLLPVICGAAAQHGGFAAALGVLAVTHLAIVLPALGLTETGRRSSPEPRGVDAAGLTA